MRAKEFITEYDAFDKGNYIQKKILGDKYLLKAKTVEMPSGKITLLINVYDPTKPQKVDFLDGAGLDGIATFRFSKGKDGKVYSYYSDVSDDYQRQGIGTEVYKFVKKLGYDLVPSSQQSDKGKAMWKSFKDKGVLNEVPLPPDWDPEKMNLRQTFKDRLKYALDRAKRLGGGSSRVAMIIDYEGRPTALKVAKNLKGLAQNEAEIEILKDYYVGNLPIVIPLIDYDKANNRPVWLQTEIAKKVRGDTLMKMLHTPSMWLLTNLVRNISGKRGPHDMDDEKIKKYYFETANDRWQPTEEDWNIFRQYCEELAELVTSSTLEIGDLQEPANWGVYNGRPVIIDLGFTAETAPLYGYMQNGWQKVTI